jgi:hypothetical protein
MFNGVAMRNLGVLAIVASTVVVVTGCDSSSCPKGTTLEGKYCKTSAATEPTAGDTGQTGAFQTGAGSSGLFPNSPPATAGVGGNKVGTGAGVGAATGSAAGAGSGTNPPAGGAGVGSQINGAAGSPGVASEACATEGTTRCKQGGAGQREKCTGGYWVSGPACAATEACSADGSCKPVAELCRGSAGEAVCDGQGALLICNADSTAGAPQMCKSATHCRAGLASRACAMCIPNQEFMCTGTTLSVCAPDGMSFARMTDCPTAALCNDKVGKCTTAACEPGKTTCMGDMLTKCNMDGTNFTGTPCGPGMCDSTGGDCNKCQPGAMSCDQGKVLTCDAQGQATSSSPCPNAGKCVGAGKCVACEVDADCSSMTKDCRVGVCSNNTCSTKEAPSRTTTCSMLLGTGVCSSGTCVGCIDDAQCSNKPGTPACDSLTHTCIECSSTIGCSTSQTCSLGACVSKCGNNRLDLGEQCDPPHTKQCDANCNLIPVLSRATPSCPENRVSAGPVNGITYCTPTCSGPNDCLATGNQKAQCTGGVCGYICGTDTNGILHGCPDLPSSVQCYQFVCIPL